MTVDIGCDITTEPCKARNENINNWTDNHKIKRNAYLKAYKKHLENALQGKQSAEDEKNVETTRTELNNHLNSLIDNNEMSIEKINVKSEKIKKREQQIQKNNNDIKNQDNNINKLNISLLSKARQIEYTNERNRNRRIMVAVLIIINLILIFVAYMLYNK